MAAQQIERETVQAMTMSAAEMSQRIVQMEVDQSITKTELIDILRQVELQKEMMTDSIEREFASVRVRIDTLINDTGRELSNLATANRDLMGRTGQAVDVLDGRIRMMEARVASFGGGSAGGGGEGRDKPRGYLPFKATIPELFGNDQAKWRFWKRDTSGTLTVSRRE